MAQRIKITGYVEIESVEDENLDLSHKSGVSNHGYETGLSDTKLRYLDDLEFELVED